MNEPIEVKADGRIQVVDENDNVKNIELNNAA